MPLTQFHTLLIIFINHMLNLTVKTVQIEVRLEDFPHMKGVFILNDLGF